jgi:tetratricopeptide (TPR) repeat protein
MTNNGLSGKDFQNMLKSTGGVIAGVIGFVTTVVAFVKLAEGNTGIVTITMFSVGIGVIEAGLLYVILKKRKPEDSLIVSLQSSFEREQKWSYSGKKRRLAFSLAVVLPALIILITGAWLYGLNHSADKLAAFPAEKFVGLPLHKFVVLVTNFDGPKQYRTTDILVKRLREATRKYPEVEIRALSQSIKEQQGPIEARKLGEGHNASVVLWGWYDATNSNAILTIHFEILSRPKYLELEHDNQMLNVALAEIEGFKIQTSLSNEMSYLTLLILGLARYEAHDYAGAINRFTDALNFPTDPKEIINPADVHFYRGNGYLFQNDLGHAIEDYDKALIIELDLAEAYSNCGLAYDEKGMHDLAIAKYNKAISLDPGASWVYHNRGVAYYKKGNLDSAIADFNIVISLDPDSPLVYNSRGLAYNDKGEYDLAIVDFNKAISIKPDYVAAYNNRGACYADQRDYDLAISDYNKAISLNSDYADGYYNRGLAYSKKGVPDLALTDYSKAISLNPDDPDFYNGRGFAYVHKGEYDLALADCNKAISLKQNYAEAYDSRGAAYEGKGEYDHALADYSKAINLKPDLIETYINRGNVYVHIGEQDRAKADFNKAEELKRAMAHN